MNWLLPPQCAQQRATPVTGEKAFLQLELALGNSVVHSQRRSCGLNLVSSLFFYRKASQAAFLCLLQLLNEKLMGAEGTKLEEDFLKMQRVKVMKSVLNCGEHLNIHPLSV